MNKQYRTEIRERKKEIKGIVTARGKAARYLATQKKMIEREESKLFRNTNRTLERLHKRIAILQGRLS